MASSLLHRDPLHLDQAAYDEPTDTSQFTLVESYDPRRVGLRVSPPLLTLEYTAGDGALYHHEVPLASYLARSSDAGQIALAITDEHRAYFAQVAPAQLRRLLEHLLLPTKVETRGVLPAADYNKVSESQLAAVKAKMDTVFHEHLCKPGDPGYVYNKEVTFNAATAASDWDDDDDE